MKITRITLIAGLAAVALAASACEGAKEYGEAPSATSVSTVTETYEPEPQPEPEPRSEKAASATTTVESVATQSKDDAFLNALASQGLGHIPDGLALDAAMTTCTFLYEGHSVEELFYEIASNPYAPDIIPGIDNVNELPQVMGAASGVYCPYAG